MITISIHGDLTGEQFRAMINFVIERSDSISVSRYYDGYLDRSDFNQLQESQKEYIYKQDTKRRENYRNNIKDYQIYINDILQLKNEQEVYLYFDTILQQDLSMMKELQYDSFSKEDDNRFVSKSDEFIKRTYTRFTPVTINPVFEMCFFKFGHISTTLINKMNGLYDYPYVIEGSEFEDIAFYKNDNVVLAVCSHERFAYLELDEKDLESFQKLGIAYE